MGRQFTKKQKEAAREVAGNALREIFDAAQVLAEVRPILTAVEKKTIISNKGNNEAGSIQNA